MAGIGFELDNILRRDTYSSLVHAYAYAIVISSGPWLFSIAGIFIITLVSKIPGADNFWFVQFRTLVVYLISISLVTSSVMQYAFSRFIADRFYEKKLEVVRPNYNGACLVIIIFSSIVALLFVYEFLPGVSIFTKIYTFLSLVSLSCVWLATISLSGLRAYKQVSISFLIAYVFMAFICYLLRDFLLNGLMLGFLLGQILLFAMLSYTIYTQYHSTEKLDFSFTKHTEPMIWLVLAGLFYNMAIWADKYLFWYTSPSKINVIGHLNASLIYDTPVFLATLTSVFSMAFFFLHLETTYMDHYKRLFQKVSGGGTLSEIYHSHNMLVSTSRYIIISVLKIQGVLLLMGIFLGYAFLLYLKIDPYYIYILNVLVLALTLNVVYWATIDLLFHLDKYKTTCCLHGLFLVSNIVFTDISIRLNIFYYGYGLAASLFVSSLTALICLHFAYKNLEYNTFV